MPACLPLGSSHSPATGHNTARLTGSVAGLVLLAFTASRLFASLLRKQEVSSDTIVGGICIYLLLGLWFAISFTRYSRDRARSLSSAVFSVLPRSLRTLRLEGGGVKPECIDKQALFSLKVLIEAGCQVKVRGEVSPAN